MRNCCKTKNAVNIAKERMAKYLNFPKNTQKNNAKKIKRLY